MPGRFTYTDFLERIDAPDAVRNPIEGVWLLRSRRLSAGAEENLEKSSLKQYRIQTGRHWSLARFDSEKRVFDGAAGGTYLLEGERYSEQVEYRSWKMADSGRVFVQRATLGPEQLTLVSGEGNAEVVESYVRVE
jgi:hypothetical protein